MRAEPRPGSLPEFLIEADDITRLAHQKTLLHKDKFRAWLEAEHTSVTGALAGSLEVIPRSPTLHGGHRAITFNVHLR